MGRTEELVSSSQTFLYNAAFVINAAFLFEI
jgi:hypothetical protein